MRIGVLTQPLKTNYGGLLQAYALQTALKRMGHESWVIDQHLSGSLGMILLRKIVYKLHPYYRLFQQQQQIAARHTAQFVQKNIQKIGPVVIKLEKARLKKYRFDAYVVGSDQVWRPCYSPYLYNYFLDFTDREKDVKRVAYAASFGVDHWELDSRQTESCARLVQKFDRVSVREQSGIKLCNDYLQVKAEQVIDPTLLLQPADYERLVQDDGIAGSEGNLMTYILDPSERKCSIIESVTKQTGLKPFGVLPEHPLKKPQKGIDPDRIVVPPVTRWLRGFMDARFVVTDSFHGCVFSILFNKPFLAIGNKDRGMSRFNSLLNLFQLEDRLIDRVADEDLEQIINRPIDWDRVNERLQQERGRAHRFLEEALSDR